jgi:hypothetical protein
MIKSIGYDPETKVLEVEFRTGKVYEYYDIRPAQHTALMNAESVGNVFNLIKASHAGRLIED